MLEQGFPMGRALEFLVMNFDRDHQKAVRLIRAELSAGTPLNEILRLLDFPSMICLQVFFAEKHGHLSETLLYAGEQWKKTEEVKGKVRKLLQYPMFLLFLLFVLLFLLNSFLMPRFEELYAALGFVPSGITLLLIVFLRGAPPALLLAALTFLLAAVSAFFYYDRQSPPRKILLLTKLPILSSYFPLVFTRLFAKEAASLLQSGFAINEVLHILQQQTVHPMLAHVAKEIETRLLIGRSFAEAVKEMPCFVSRFSLILQHGEANGRIGEEMLIFSQFCEVLIEKHIKKWTSILQPLIFSFIGMVIISIYLSVMLPMFQMVGSV